MPASARSMRVRLTARISALAILLACLITARCANPPQRRPDPTAVVSPAIPPPPERPNIVLIMADDLGREVLQCYGGSSYETPHLDELAASGARFTRAYATPRCTTTRVQIMTGQYPDRNGWDIGIWLLPRRHQVLETDMFNFAHMLRQAGYATLAVGKWQLARFDDHPDHVRDCGFDEHCVWTWDYEGDGAASHPNRYWQPSIWQNGRLALEHRREDVFGPDVVSAYLLDFLRRHQDRPFFAYYPMILPHGPFVPTPDRLTAANQLDRFPTEEDGLANVDYYREMVRYMDKIVGRIVKELDELGLRHNTVIFFTSDNGSPQAITSMFQGQPLQGEKTQLTDLGTHVPLIVNWKGVVTPSQVREELVDMTDVLPTFAELADASVPAGHVVDGQSFFPFVVGANATPRSWVMCQYGRRRFVLGNRYRLHQNKQLHDISCLPVETPVSGRPPTADAFAERQRLLEVLREHPTRPTRDNRIKRPWDR